MLHVVYSLLWKTGVTYDSSHFHFDFQYTNRNARNRTFLACAPSQDSDQPAHKRSLIRIFAVRIVDNQGFKISSRGH